MEALNVEKFIASIQERDNKIKSLEDTILKLKSENISTIKDNYALSEKNDEYLSRIWDLESRTHELATSRASQLLKAKMFHDQERRQTRFNNFITTLECLMDEVLK